jgi:anti-sigma factor RsiW
MRIDEGTLRAYLDHELSEEAMDMVKEQLADSPEAQAMLARLSQERLDVAPHLNALAPSATAPSSTSQTWQRFQTSTTGQLSQPLDKKERTNQMSNPSFFKRYQPAIITLAVIAIVAIALSFAPVRAIAGNLLSVFRVQNVQVVPVDEDHMRSMRSDPQINGILEDLEAEVDVISDGGEPEEVDSVEQADEKVNFSVGRITALPDGLDEPTRIEVGKQRVVAMHLDKALLDALFEAAEIEISLPDSLNEQPIVVTQPDAVMQHWQVEANRLEFIQMASPSVEYPDDLDLNALGAAGLQFLGMSKDEAEALSDTIDWANTLILPVPRDGEISVTEISLNGTKGFLFVDKKNSDSAALMWTQNGMTYFISGDYSAEQIVEMAQSVK